MIPDKTRTQIRTLLESGCYYDTEVARMTGTCVDTVKAVKHRRGKINQIGAAQHPGNGQRCKAPEIIPPDMEAEPSWCPMCRAMVYQPCVKCQLRILRRAEGVYGLQAASPELDLDNEVEDDDHKTTRDRYLEMRTHKGGENSS